MKNDSTKPIIGIDMYVLWLLYLKNSSLPHMKNFTRLILDPLDLLQRQWYWKFLYLSTVRLRKKQELENGGNRYVSDLKVHP